MAILIKGESSYMSKDDKIVGAIIFGLILVISLKLIELGIEALFVDFAASNHYVVIAIAGAGAALLAFVIAQKYFPGSFRSH